MYRCIRVSAYSYGLQTSLDALVHLALLSPAPLGAPPAHPVAHEPDSARDRPLGVPLKPKAQRDVGEYEREQLEPEAEREVYEVEQKRDGLGGREEDKGREGREAHEADDEGGCEDENGTRVNGTFQSQQARRGDSRFE